MWCATRAPCAGRTRAAQGSVADWLDFRHFATCAWWAANLSCELFGWLYPEQYQRVRYEDIARSHTEALKTLFAALPTQSAAAPRTEMHGNRHQLYGNHSRYKSFAPAENSRRQTLEDANARRPANSCRGAHLAFAAQIRLLSATFLQRVDEREVVAVTVLKHVKRRRIEVRATRAGGALVFVRGVAGLDAGHPIEPLH